MALAVPCFSPLGSTSFPPRVPDFPPCSEQRSACPSDEALAGRARAVCSGENALGGPRCPRPAGSGLRRPSPPLPLPLWASLVHPADGSLPGGAPNATPSPHAVPVDGTGRRIGGSEGPDGRRLDFGTGPGEEGARRDRGSGPWPPSSPNRGAPGGEAATAADPPGLPAGPPLSPVAAPDRQCLVGVCLICSNPPFSQATPTS